MKHKYLEELRVANFAENSYLNSVNKSYIAKHPIKCLLHYFQDRRKFKKDYKEYGFNVRDTWALDSAFYMWLYERLRWFLDKGGEVIDLSYYKFSYDSEQYTQKELTQLLIDKLRDMIAISEYHGDFEETHLVNNSEELRKEICELWCILLPYTWW